MHLLKIRHELRKSFMQNTQILRKYVYAVITQLSQFYAIILRRYYTEITQNKLRNPYAYYAIIMQINYAEIRK